MKGVSIYLAKKELEKLLEVLNEWEEVYRNEHEDIYAHHLENGLGYAWRKLSEKYRKLN